MFRHIAWPLAGTAFWALLTFAAYPPLNLWPLIVLAPAALTMAALTGLPTSTKQMVAIVLPVAFGLWLVMDAWLIQVTPLGYPFKAAGMAAYTLLFAWAVRRIAQHHVMGRLPMALIVPVVWVAVEFIRGEIAFYGYPWFLLAHPLAEAPILVQSADLFGTYFVSFLAAMAGGTIVDLVRMRRQMRGREAASVLTVVGVMLGANVGYGAWRVGQTGPLSPGPAILVVQTNLPTDNKLAWTLDDQVRDFEAFLQLTRDGLETARLAERDVDLIVWPETMAPGHGFDQATLDYLKDFVFFLEDQTAVRGDSFGRIIEMAVAETGVPMLVGSPVFIGLELTAEGRRWDRHYNSAYLIDGSPPYQRYDKYFLTPFGEVMPYIEHWPWLERRLLGLGARGMAFNLDAANELRTLRFEWDGRATGLATPICFEAVMASVNRRLVYQRGEKRADVLINLTNDGWFGWHDGGRVQHAQISRLRAIENRVPMVRAANTGMSVWIDSAGRLREAVGGDRAGGWGGYGIAQQAGTMLAEVTLDSRRTLYGRIGEVWGWLALLTAAAAFGWTSCRPQGPLNGGR
jgi:apolipoprotein N-acyltransferase